MAFLICCSIACLVLIGVGPKERLEDILVAPEVELLHEARLFLQYCWCSGSKASTLRLFAKGHFCAWAEGRTLLRRFQEL